MSTHYLLFIFCLLISAAGYTQQNIQQERTLHRGICWVGGRVAVTEQQLAELKAKNIEWISQTPFGWQQAIDSPVIATNADLLANGKNILWGESDDGIIKTTQYAKLHGIKTLLKPHIWLTPKAGEWRGQIGMRNEMDWQTWFAAYERFILHYARLAENTGIEAFSIGTELHQSILQRPHDWRKLIGKIRTVYSGQLTYSANFYQEYQQVTFWDLLDFIGIQAYFPITTIAEPDVETLLQGWLPHLQALEALQHQHDKSVVFTEVGYRSIKSNASQPWVWPDRHHVDAATISLSAQANAFEAMFQTFWDQDWFGGVYVWKWYPYLNGEDNYSSDSSAPPINTFSSIDFTPQDKPAEQVIINWFSKK